jgi:hypothetical protein
MTGRNNDPSTDGDKRSMPEHRRCAVVSRITDNLRVGDAIDRQHRLREYSAISNMSLTADITTLRAGCDML